LCCYSTKLFRSCQFPFFLLRAAWHTI
jgi:hypothetical protein